MSINVAAYITLSGITMLISFYFGIRSIFKARRKRPGHAFTILSAAVFIMALSTMVLLVSSNTIPLRISAYLLHSLSYIFPAALFHYAVERMDYNFFKKDIVRYFFYIPSIAIVLFLSFTGGVSLKKVSYGYTFHTQYTMELGFSYLAPFLLLIISYISYNLYRTKKTNYPVTRIIVLLAGVVFFTLATVIMRPVEALFRFGIPYNIIFMFVLFILIAISDYIEYLTIDSLTFSKMFESIDDCVIITDKMGDIVEVNLKMVKTIFGETDKRHGFDSNEIKSRMFSAADSAERLAGLFKYFKDDSLENISLEIGCSMHQEKRSFDINASPIMYRKDKLLGKIAIFRDITEIKVLQERLRDESIRDFLTDAYNRRYFYEILENTIKRFNRYKKPFSLLMIDIDNFKKLNDTYGHLKGDWLLQELTGILGSSIRSGIDSIVRYGGDEFVVILDDSDIDRAKAVSDRVIKEFSEIDRKGTSLSIGISQYREGMSQDELIKEADSVMYEAKLEKGDAIKSVYR